MDSPHRRQSDTPWTASSTAAPIRSTPRRQRKRHTGCWSGSWSDWVIRRWGIKDGTRRPSVFFCPIRYHTEVPFQYGNPMLTKQSVCNVYAETEQCAERTSRQKHPGVWSPHRKDIWLTLLIRFLPPLISIST